MKRTAYCFALLLAFSLCACGNVNDTQPMSTPAPTNQVIPQATAEVTPDITTPKSDDDGMMTNGSVVSPSPMPSASPSPAVPGAEASSSPAPTDNAAK